MRMTHGQKVSQTDLAHLLETGVYSKGLETLNLIKTR